MGLTIHYSLRASGSDGQAQELIHALRQIALALSFRKLGPMVDLAGEQCDSNKRSSDDALRWLLVQATESVEYKPEGRNHNPRYRTWYNVLPCRLIAFDTWPGEGCEAANFGLCRYPAVVQTNRGPLRTGLSGWRWSSFCKTQYASNPRCGGVPNFVRCHLTIIALLDRAKELGCLEEVSDEGGFWQNRDLPALVREIGSWNELLAGFGGVLKDLVEDGPLGVESPITQYPNFEQLEATGQSKLPPAFAELAQLIGRVGGTRQQMEGARCEPSPSRARG